MTVTRTKLVVVAAAAVVVGGWLLFDWLQETDKEKLHRMVVTLEKAVEEHDAEACAALADEKSWDWIGTRQELVQLLQQLFAMYQPEKVIIQRETIDIRPPQSTIHLMTFVQLGRRSPFPGLVRSTWIIDCRKQEDGRWYITRAVVELQDGSVQTISQLADMARGALRSPGRRNARPSTPAPGTIP